MVIHDFSATLSGAESDGKLHFYLSGDNSAIRTFSHETLHLIKEMAPEKYTALTEYLKRDYGAGKFSDLVETKAAEYNVELNDTTRAMLEEEAYAELSEKMLSDTKALEKFANRELDTAKTFRKQLQKVSDAIHNALNKLGLDLGKSAAKDIKYAQETVDAWVDGMTTAISNAQKRKAQARQKQETVAQQETATAQEVKAEQKQEARKGTVQDLELAVEAARADVKNWDKYVEQQKRTGFSTETSRGLLAESVQNARLMENMLAKVRKGDALTTAELATLDDFHDRLYKYGYAYGRDWHTFREQGQKAETKAEQSNNRMFMLNDNFVTELHEWYKGDRNGNKRFYVGRTSEVLSKITGQEKDIYWYGSKINEIKKKHHNMTLPVIEQVPHILESPVMVLDSRTVDGRIVMFGDVYDKSGNPVLAAVELSASNGSIDDFVLIASAYARGEEIKNPKSRTEALQNFINESNVRYVTEDKKRIQSWLKRTGLQLPFGAKLGFNDVSISVSSENVNGKFSLNDAVEETRDLIAVHNVSETNLLKMLKLGGFPAVSIAVTKAKKGWSSYGDISVVFGKETVDPEANPDNHVYGEDAWTPTFPEINHDMLEIDPEHLAPHGAFLNSDVQRRLDKDFNDKISVSDFLQKYRHDAPMIQVFL